MAHDIIFILILCTCCIVFVGAGEICTQQFEIPKWEPGESQPCDMDIRPRNNDGKTVLRVIMENVTESFNLSLLARPYETEKCPPATSKYEELRRFHQHWPINMQNNGKKIGTDIEDLFTGCYYFQMENAEGKKWIRNPYFYKGSSRFLDTALKCAWLHYEGPNFEAFRQLQVRLQVPLICSVLKCELFELEKTDRNTIDNLNSRKILAKQTCRVTWRGIRETPLVKCFRADTKLNLTASAGNEVSEQWETTIEWKHLKTAKAQYYSKYEIDYQYCSGSNAKLLEWPPVVKFGAVIHAPNSTNIPEPVPSGFFESNSTIILSTILSFTVLAVLVYWVKRYVTIMLNKKRRSNNLFVKPQETAQLYHLNESDDILLIYARDSPEIMRAMDALRERLRETCHFRVRDVYATNEWSLVAELGATRWVEDRLREGSKVVWVDTPKFRSVVTNNNSEKHAQNQYDAIDFRDEAIPYAVILATHLFQNAATQYRQHFVVRLEGLKVGDGSDDPLLTVSPHARYFVPEHLDLLDKHLAR